MLNTVLTLQIKVLLALLAGTAIASTVLTYTITQLTSPTSPVCPTVCTTPAATAPQPKPIPREQYFKVHKAKLDGERF